MNIRDPARPMEIAATVRRLLEGSSMPRLYTLIRVGQASRKTCSGGGTLLLEENMIFHYDPV